MLFLAKRNPSSFFASYFPFCLSLLLRIVYSTLEEPTLVGVKECTVLPSVRLPLYWSSKYSPDRKDHRGPKDISTIIGTNSTTRLRTALGLPPILGGGKFGTTASDGTIRTSVEDVTNPARVVVVAFVYADLHKCSELLKDISELIDEANAEHLAESILDSTAQQGNANSQTKGGDSIRAVAINNMWPLQCDELDEKCNGLKSGALEESEWQRKVIQAAPKIPLLQDTAKERAWDSQFGAYYTDVIIYLDGKVYKYLPSALAMASMAHSAVLTATFLSRADVAEAHNLLNNPEELKATLLRALKYPTKWCDEGQWGDPTLNTNSNHVQKKVSSSSSWYHDQALQDSPYHDIVLGFFFAALAITSIIMGSLCMRCFCGFWNRICCPKHRFRRFEMEEDRLGEFRPLAMADEYDMKTSGYASYHGDEGDPDRYEYGMSDGDEEDYSLPIQRITNPNKAAEEFFKRQEAAEREMSLQEALARNSVEDDEDDQMTSLDLEMIERKIVESIGSSGNKSI